MSTFYGGEEIVNVGSASGATTGISPVSVTIYTCPAGRYAEIYNISYSNNQLPSAGSSALAVGSGGPISQAAAGTLELKQGNIYDTSDPTLFSAGMSKLIINSGETVTVSRGTATIYFKEFVNP